MTSVLQGLTLQSYIHIIISSGVLWSTLDLAIDSNPDTITQFTSVSDVQRLLLLLNVNNASIIIMTCPTESDKDNILLLNDTRYDRRKHQPRRTIKTLSCFFSLVQKITRDSCHLWIKHVHI